MLERLREHIRACEERAAQCEKCAGQADEPLKSDYLKLAKRWAHLADSYKFSENLERFLIDADADAKARHDRQHNDAAWKPIATAPYDRNLRLAVLDAEGVAHALVFPCRRVPDGWIKSATKAHVHIDPTHWREWKEDG